MNTCQIPPSGFRRTLSEHRRRRPCAFIASTTLDDGQPLSRVYRTKSNEYKPSFVWHRVCFRGSGLTRYEFASGILGWNLPAAVGLALAERDSGRNRPVIAIIGDGSFQYSIQSLWTAAQLRLPILIVVPRNDEYCILKSFAVLEETPGVPGLDLPGFDVVSIAKGYGCDAAARLDDLEAIKKGAVEAWSKSKPTVLEIPISAQVPPLLCQLPDLGLRQNGYSATGRSRRSGGTRP